MRAIARWAIIVCILAGVFALVHFTPMRGLIGDFRSTVERLRAMGPVAPAVFVAAGSLSVAAGCPRLALCVIGGMAFGFVPGLLWSQLASILGGYATFLFVRWGGRDFVLRRWPKLHRLSETFASRGIPTVIVLRQIPVHTLLTNFMLGLTPIRHRDFLIGTLVGNLPEAVPFTLIGTGALDPSVGRSVGFIGAAILALIALWICVAHLLRSSRVAAEIRREFAFQNSQEGLDEG